MKHRAVRCLLGFHTFRIAHTEDGQPFKRCIRCGKDHDGTAGFDGTAAGYSQPMI